MIKFTRVPFNLLAISLLVASTPQTLHAGKLSFLRKTSTPLQDDSKKLSKSLGLKNLGNTCYFNAAMKLLAAHPEISRATEAQEGRTNQNTETHPTGQASQSIQGQRTAIERYRKNLNTLLLALQKGPKELDDLSSQKETFQNHEGLLALLQSERKDAHLPFVSFTEGRQQDANAYLMAALSAIEYDKFFDGFAIRNFIRFPSGRGRFQSEEPLKASEYGSTLEVQIHNATSISQGIGILYSTSTMSDVRDEKNNNSLVNIESTPVRIIKSETQLPRYLFVNVARVMNFGNYLHRIEGKVAIDPITLDFATEGTYGTSRPRKVQAQYVPIAGIAHIGSSDGGHYTTYALNPKLGRWYWHNDTSVRSVSEKEALDVLSTNATLILYALP